MVSGNLRVVRPRQYLLDPLMLVPVPRGRSWDSPLFTPASEAGPLSSGKETW